jgi:DNA polymerase
LFAASTLPELDPRHSFSVPAAFVELAHVAILNRDPERFALLYRLLIPTCGNNRT